jgi:competence protein ComEC
MNRINEFVHGEDERAIAIALVLGVTDGIDNDLQNAYAASGAMHVLAVSGMHVGIIYAIILFLFKPLAKMRGSKWIVAAVSFISLWIFSFVTGNSPSVLRAVTMFSFIAAARPFGVRTNIYNTLAASAFVLLIHNPYLIMSVGFQLSYLAVIGIVYLQRPLYQLWEIENTIGDWIWKITCVSIAAQTSTFALGLLYFHQFPTYFLVSNLFVIPLSTLVLLGGIFLLAVSFISPLASFVGSVLELLIKALNWIVFKTEGLPFSLINNIHLTIFQCWLLMGILVSLILLFEFRTIKWLYAAFGLTLIFAFAQWSHFSNEVDQQQMVVYSINKHKAIEFIDRGHSYFISDSSLLIDSERIRFHILPNRLIHGVTKTEFEIAFLSERNGVNFYQWNKHNFAWIDSKDDRLPVDSSIDYLIVSQNSLQKNQIAKLKVKQIIFDASNSRRYVELITDLAKANKIATYSVIKEGAFIY